jgi:putative transposase
MIARDDGNGGVTKRCKKAHRLLQPWDELRLNNCSAWKVQQQLQSLEPKNQIIRDTLKKTIERRKTQNCKQYELKIDISHLNKNTLKHLSSIFLEAKWYYNHVLANGNIFQTDYKIDTVDIKVKDHFEARNIEHLSSQMKQEIIERMKDNIRGLSKLKKKGQKVGRLKFKSEVNSIPLKQYGKTYWVIDKHYVHIQGIKQKLRARGIFQIPTSAELASALLIRKHGDYFLHVTTYELSGNNNPSPEAQQQQEQESTTGSTSLGIDLGIKNQLTLSNGIRINYEVPITDQMRRLCRKLSRKQYRSHNWWKTKTKLEKAYDRTKSIKKDIKNKLVHKLTQQFKTICYQDDSIKAWQQIWGKRILNTSLGGIASALEKKAQTPIEVPRFIPTTQECSQCNTRNETNLSDRIYGCVHCGLSIDRDLNAAINISKEGVPTVRRELTPADTLASTLVGYLNKIPYVRASMVVVETGSLAVGRGLLKPAIFSRR